MGDFGPFCFGLVIGWVTYRTLRRKVENVAIGDIAAVIGAIGGAAIVAIFKNEAFNAYCIGTAVGFFAYLVVGTMMDEKAYKRLLAAPADKKDDAKGSVGGWMG
ncbi:MAG: hypothetical protein H6Q33_2482 [Deltaproteobacteria bacterium]|jgi:outer membrane lipoprotein SlyB|nr:hypothetical protein [Deltaproteobacteria bacterium]